jgi:carbon storage regulator
MLVLTRHPNQSIMIGSDVIITVLEVRGDQVRIGIKAPRSVEVHREEVWAQLQKANRDAAVAPDAAALGALGGVKKPTADAATSKPTIGDSKPAT